MELKTISDTYFTLSVVHCYHTTQNRISVTQKIGKQLNTNNNLISIFNSISSFRQKQLPTNTKQMTMKTKEEENHKIWEKYVKK
jgi:ribosomal protein S24E